MEIHLCDICKKELKPGTMVGSLQRIKEIFGLNPTAPSEAAPVKRMMAPEVLELCEDCQKKIWVYAEVLQKAVKK